MLFGLLHMSCIRTQDQPSGSKTTALRAIAPTIVWSKAEVVFKN